VEFSWAGENARIIGTVVHRLLQEAGRRGGLEFDKSELDRLQTVAVSLLAHQGVPMAYLEKSARQVRKALEAALASERGQWMLSAEHSEVESELPLSMVVDGRVRRMVLDRTFVDAEGTRWIIDYKTGMHGGGAVDEFLDREQERYRMQLENYARAMQLLEERPVRLGLYFPLLDGWREWEYKVTG
jgi:ATP-dependent exoDNAse (exonuclease V) beta subunit